MDMFMGKIWLWRLNNNDRSSNCDIDKIKQNIYMAIILQLTSINYLQRDQV